MSVTKEYPFLFGIMKRMARLQAAFIARLAANRPAKRAFFMRIRFMAVLLFMAIMQLSAKSAAQTHITLNKKNITIEEIFEEIRLQTGLNVLYSAKKLNDKKRLTVNFKNATVQEVLEKTIEGLPLTYVIKEKTILITAANTKSNAAKAAGGDRAAEALHLIDISGRVTDTLGNPLEKASVVVKGTSITTLTDADGRFTISNVEKGAVLQISFVGFITREVKIDNDRVINIQLQHQNTFSEIVIIGYGKQKKSDLTGSIVSIKGDQIGLQAVANPLQALTGVASGVEVLQNSGQPGSAVSVRVRGSNSLLGSNDPLFVIDGFPISGGLENINSNDIQSMEILKDASATAIYGSRGANGVVIVTTKKGLPNESRIEYNAYYGIQSAYKKIDMLNAREFATLANLRAKNDGQQPYFTPEQINAFGEGTDWQDGIFRTGALQNHSLRVAGGSEKTTFNISGNLLDQQGIIINSYFNQMQLMSSIEHRLFKGWKFSLNSILNRTKTHILRSDNSSRGNGVLSGALVAPPTLEIYNPDGTYSNIRAYAFSPDIAINPVMNALERMDVTTKHSFLGNAALEGSITKNLVFKTSVGAEYASKRGDFYSPSIIHITATGDASLRYTESYNIVNENTLTFSKVWNRDHDLNILGGITSQQTTEQGVLARATGFQTDLLDNLNLQSGNSPGTPESFRIRYSILSGLGRINYHFKNRYLITASLRADGSSRFGTENKWGYFPSVAAAWKVSNEAFWNKLKPAFNEFKLRGSWGKTGNTSVAPYQSLSILGSLPVVFDNSLHIGFGPGSNQPNPMLKWETTSQFDAGFDLSISGNRFLITFDYYYKKTSDLLTSTPVAISTGYTTMSRNIGSVQNKGIDASVNASILSGTFSWDMGVNFSANRNKVLKLAGGTDIFGETIGLPISLPVNLVREGYPVGVFFGYVENGLTEKGDIDFKDIDGNTVINSLDRTIIGDPNPDYILGLHTRLSYKKISLSLVLNSVQGNDIFNFNASNLADGFSFGINQIKDVLGNYWTEENPNPRAKYPRISANTRYLVSDRFIEDGSYIRLRNVKLAYHLDGLRVGNTSLKNAQVYVSAQNLLTITKYSFYSPDVNTIGAGISRGVDQFGYPDARTFLIGLKLEL